MNKYKGIIFDLDGTLLNTIDDITKALNYALSKNGLTNVTVSESKYLVGNGAKVLIERTLNKVCDSNWDMNLFENVYNDYMFSYNLWKTNTTIPYQSVVKTLHILQRKNIKLAVLSNKPERDTKDVVKKYFGDIFDIVRGGREGVPLKPDPTAVNEMISEMGLKSDEVIYVGDSNVDMETGKNASLYSVGACYGFRTKKELVAAGTDYTINSFYEILNLFEPEPNGIILVDKAKGISSQECITKVKKAIGSNKIGHAGTLDPLATGLLVVLLGDATKLSNYLLEDYKTYISEVTIGKTTNTLDLEGTVTEEKKVEKITEEEIDEILSNLIGDIDMEVPIHSAIKVKGQKLYEIARKGNENDVELPVKTNHIYKLQRTSELYYENDTLKFSFYACVSKGTYIRKLCEEIGKRLNYPAFMSVLRRIASGRMKIENAYTLDDIYKGNYKIIDIIEAVKDYNLYEVNDFLYNRVINGMPIRLYDVPKEDVFITYHNKLIAIYEYVEENNYKAKRIWK